MFKHGTKQYGLSSCLIQNIGTGAWAYFLSPSTLVINDNVELVDGKNSAGVDTEKYTGAHTCDGSLTVTDFSHIHMGILAGYTITDDTPSGNALVAKTRDVVGTNWSAATISLASGAVPGVYHVKETAQGVEQTQIVGFAPGDSSVAIMASAPSGVQTNDEAIIEVMPPTAEQGIIKAIGGTNRPAVRIVGWTDAKQRTGDSGAVGIEVHSAYFPAIPLSMASVTEVTRELNWNATINENGTYYESGYFQAI